ncbi:MAG: hypothetical protein ACKVXR_08150 [Planctomycetota bacterium]
MCRLARSTKLSPAYQARTGVISPTITPASVGRTQAHGERTPTHCMPSTLLATTGMPASWIPLG